VLVWRAQCRKLVCSRCHAAQQLMQPAFSLRSVPVVTSSQQ
jgi:hypothetical protein